LKVFLEEEGMGGGTSKNLSTTQRYLTRSSLKDSLKKEVNASIHRATNRSKRAYMSQSLAEL